MIHTPRTMGNAHKQKIIELLRREGDMSRADIARKLHLSSPAVTANITSLLECGMVTESGAGEAEYGRKPVLIGIDANFCDVLGIDIREKQVYAAAANFSGEFHARLVRDYCPGDGAGALLETICSMTDTLIADGSITKLAAIAVSVPGIVDQKAGKITLSTIVPDLDEIDFRGILQERYGVLVGMENDVDMAILGEAAEEGSRRDMFYLKVGGGAAARIMVNGSLLRGRTNTAGEIGYMLLDKNYCQTQFQSRGALEQEIFNSALDERYRRFQTHCSPQDYISLRRLTELADTGDAAAQAVLETVIDSVSRVVVNVEALLDIGYVVLGGDLEYLSSAHIAQMREFVGRYIPQPPEIVPCRLGALAEMKGCISSAIARINEEIDRYLVS